MRFDPLTDGKSEKHKSGPFFLDFTAFSVHGAIAFLALRGERIGIFALLGGKIVRKKNFSQASKKCPRHLD
jgi:hypothetical protein